MINNKISFQEIKLLEINGQSRRIFSGEYSINELKNILIEEWIPFRACGGCGKNDYCKFSLQNDKDSQCGVAISALDNFLKDTFHEILDSTDYKKQMFLDSAFYFCKYVLESEQVNSILINRAKFKQYGWDSKAYSAMIPPIRETLNEFSKSLKEIPELFKKNYVLLVEGQSEMVFINYLRGNGHSFRNWFFIVDSYYGKDKKKPGQIKMLLDKYKETGYLVCLQGDEDGNGDGSGYDKFKSFIHDNYILKENVFQFKYDFETAIPKKTIYNYLKEQSLLKDVSYDDFDKKTKGESINKCLLEEFNIDTKRNKLKKRIAEYAGKTYFIIKPEETEVFKRTELGAFVEFLNNLN
jgi:hypothetical protein